MKIILVIHGYPMRYNAGSEVYTQALAMALAHRHEVQIFTRWFCPLSQTHRPVLCAFRSPDQDELFHTLVVPFVGLTNNLK